MRLVVNRSSVLRPKAWLRRVVRNLLYDQRMRRRRRAGAHSRIQRQSREPESPSGAWRAVADVEHILSELSPRTRRLLELYRRGYKHSEIATLLDCECHQVGPRVRRALETARRRTRRRRRGQTPPD